MIMYQVIVLYQDNFYHEGFFDNESSAVDHRDFLSQKFYYSDLEAQVFVNSFDYE